MSQTLEELKADLEKWTAWRKRIIERETKLIANARQTMEDANHVFDQHATALHRAIAKLEPAAEPKTKTVKSRGRYADIQLDDENFTQEEIDLFNKLRKATA